MWEKIPRNGINYVLYVKARMVDIQIIFLHQPRKHIMQTPESYWHYCWSLLCGIPDSKVHQANMGPTWVLWAPSGPMNLAIRDTISDKSSYGSFRNMYVAWLKKYSILWNKYRSFYTIFTMKRLMKPCLYSGLPLKDMCIHNGYWFRRADIYINVYQIYYSKN